MFGKSTLLSQNCLQGINNNTAFSWHIWQDERGQTTYNCTSLTKLFFNGDTLLIPEVQKTWWFYFQSLSINLIVSQKIESNQLKKWSLKKWYSQNYAWRHLWMIPWVTQIKNLNEQTASKWRQWRQNLLIPLVAFFPFNIRAL